MKNQQPRPSPPNPHPNAKKPSQGGEGGRRPDEGRSVRSHGKRHLAAWLASIAFVWLVALPWLSHRAPVARDLDWLDRHGIDPSAMYYTELDAMKPILRRLNRQSRNAGQREAVNLSTATTGRHNP